MTEFGLPENDRDREHAAILDALRTATVTVGEPLSGSSRLPGNSWMWRRGPDGEFAPRERWEAWFEQRRADRSD
jgi:hypothetical protein